jgi:hypothetical protein
MVRACPSCLSSINLDNDDSSGLVVVSDREEHELKSQQFLNNFSIFDIVISGPVLLALT